MDKWILMISSVISCIIVVSIMFQFWNDRYVKVFRNKYLYILLPTGCIISTMLANMLMNTVVNLAVNILWVGLVSGIFYREDRNRRYMRIMESEALLVINGVTEAMGVFLVDLLLYVFQVTPESLEIKQSIETTFSKLVLLFFYYIVFSRLWKKGIIRTIKQYILYFVMFLYGIVNILATALISSREHPVVLILIISCNIFANMYMLYFVKCMDERNFYKLQMEMMKQQEKLQFENYEIQCEKYAEAMTILHDVNKHISMIEGLYQNGQRNTAISYTRQINEILRPLVPIQYVNNAILNCLLADKVRVAERYHIALHTEISTADINFMKPVDITTLFGNLLDNAINACRKCEGGTYINLLMHAHREMISIRVENSTFQTMSVSEGKLSGALWGIGMLNIQRCVETYNGSIIYRSQDKALICDILLCRSED